MIKKLTSSELEVLEYFFLNLMDRMHIRGLMKSIVFNPDIVIEHTVHINEYMFSLLTSKEKRLLDTLCISRQENSLFQASVEKTIF